MPRQTGRNAPPIPPQWLSREPWSERPPLAEFVFLSMLLHALAIALFGAPSGGTSEGRAMWGSLQVVLQGAYRDAGPPKLKLEREVAAPPVPASAPRPVETRPAEPVPPAEPQLQTRQPRVDTPPAQIPYVFPPLLDRIVTPELKLDKAPVLRVPKPTEVQTQSPPPPEVTTTTEPPVQRVETPPPAPVISVPTLSPLEAPAIPRPIAPRVERVPEQAPPLPAPLVEPVPAPVEQRAVTPPVERPPIAAPPLPVVPSSPVTSPVLPSARPVESVPVPMTPIPVTPLETIAPPKLEPLMKAPELPPAPAPAPTLPAAPTPPTAIERAIERRMLQEPAAPSGPDVSAPSAPRPSTQQPSSTQPYDPTKPGLDLDSVRKRAGEMARQGTGQRALLPFPMPPVPAKKSKMETAIENARKPDCKTAYQDLGLAAVVPLIANEFGEGNCRWTK